MEFNFPQLLWTISRAISRTFLLFLIWNILACTLGQDILLGKKKPCDRRWHLYCSFYEITATTKSNTKLQISSRSSRLVRKLVVVLLVPLHLSGQRNGPRGVLPAHHLLVVLHGEVGIAEVLLATIVAVHLERLGRVQWRDSWTPAERHKTTRDFRADEFFRAKYYLILYENLVTTSESRCWGSEEQLFYEENLLILEMWECRSINGKGCGSYYTFWAEKAVPSVIQRRALL